MKENLPFYRPSVTDIDNESINSCKNNFAETLENKSKEIFSSKFAVATCSSANALHLALCALDIKRGDKIICSVNSFATTPHAIRHFDAEPIFVDCDNENYLIDIDQLETALELNNNKKLRAIIINSLDGAIIDLNRVSELSKKYNVKLIFDATDAIGINIHHKEINKLFDAFILSFAPNIHKDIISGAILLLNDEMLHSRAIILRGNGVINQLPKNNIQANYAYDIQDIGYDYAINELSAFVCIQRLANLESVLKRNSEIAKQYTEQLNNINHISIVTDANQVCVTNFFIEIDKNRDHFAKELLSEGIEIALHYVPLHLSEYYRNKYALKVFDFPNALSIYQKTMVLPLYPDMSDNDVNRVIQSIKNVALRHMK